VENLGFPNFLAGGYCFPQCVEPCYRCSVVFDYNLSQLACSTPDEFRNRRDLSLDLLQRSTPSQPRSPGFTSPRSSMLGLVPPPLPIFQPSPMRSQGSSYLSPESRARRRQSDISDLQNFSLSPQLNGRSSIGENGVSEAPLASSFAEILDGHSRISPKSFSLAGDMGRTGNMPFAQLFKSGHHSEGRGNHLVPLQTGNSPLQLKADEIFGTGDKDAGNEGMAGRRRRALDFSDPLIQAGKGHGNGSLYSSPQKNNIGLEDGMDNLLPIHPLKDSSHEAANSDGKSGEDEDCHKDSDTRFLSSRSMDTMAQSPISMRPGITRKEHLIDSPAVKEATDAAVAAAMRANAGVAKGSSPKRPQRAAAAGVAAAAAAAAGMPSKSRRSLVSNMRIESEKKDNVSVPSLFASSAISRFVEGENGCLKCKCKKSRCLKLYCECFKAQGYCGAGCSCSGCSNREENKDEIILARESILSRNPHAFAEKISETFVPSQNGVVTAGPQHRKGCNCKKSKCLKKYCECYQAGIACGDHCKCDGCHNTLQHYSSQSAKQSSRSGHDARAHPLDTIGSSSYLSRNGTFANNSMQARNFLLQKNGFDGRDISYLVSNSTSAKLALGNLFKNREADSEVKFSVNDSRSSSAVAVSGGQFLVPIPWPLGKPKEEIDDTSHSGPIDKLTPIAPAIAINEKDKLDTVSAKQTDAIKKEDTK